MNFIFSTIEPLVRTLMFFIDNIVYGLISYLYELIFYLSSIDISNFSGAESLINRIYILLGVYMLFKLAFSIIQYIINPDTATDGEKGFGKLATNVMVALILLVSVPWIFQELYKVQGFVLKSNVIGTLVMGDTISTSSEDKIDVDEVKKMAKDTQFLLYGAFASLNVGDDGIADIAACSSTTILGTNGMASNTPCLEAINEYFNSEEDLKNVQIKLYDFFKYENESGEIVDERDFSAYGTLITKGDDGKWLINYLPIFSTLAGGYVALLLITFCIDIAARAIKLIFLQMVAPISIISYIDPKESVSNSKLRNWVAEVIKTWASLFIRLLVIFLIMKLVAMVSNTVLGAFDGFELNNGMFKDGTTVTGVSQMLIFVLLVIGAFQFAKKVPELLESVLGIKGSGDLSLNPFKTFETGAAGKAAGAVIGGAVGSVTGAMGALVASRDNKDIGVGKTLFNTARGFVSGGASSSLSGLRKGVSSGFTTGKSAAGRQSRAVDIRGTTTALQRTGARARNALGMQSKKETLDSRIATYDSVADKVSKMEERAKSQLALKNSHWKICQVKREKLKQDYIDNKINSTEYKDALEKIEKQENAMVQQYIDKGVWDSTKGAYVKDSDIEVMKEETKRIASENKFTIDGSETGAEIDITSNWSDFKKIKSTYKTKSRDLKASEEYDDATKVDNYVKSSVGQKHMNS